MITTLNSEDLKSKELLESSQRKQCENQVFDGYNFTGFQIHNLTINNCVFKNCKFDEAKLVNVKTRETSFENCSFEKITLNSDVAFIRCHFQKTSFNNNNIKAKVTFDTDIFDTCTWNNSSIEEAEFYKSSFLNSNFSKFKLRRCGLLGTLWEGTVFSPTTKLEYCKFHRNNTSETHDIFNDKSDKICFVKPHQRWNWKLISKIGRLPTLEFSWSVFAIGLFLLSAILFINDSKFIIEGIRYPIPIPDQLIWLTLGSFCVSLGTFFYRAGCPERIQNFTENEWVEEHGHPRVFYREQCVQNIKWLYATTVFLTIGILILSYLIICRIAYVIIHLLM